MIGAGELPKPALEPQMPGSYLKVHLLGWLWGGADADAGGADPPVPQLVLAPPSPPHLPGTRGVSCEKSKAPNGWTYGGFIILVFLPKTFPALLQKP